MMSLFMAASVSMLGATTAALCMMVLRGQRRWPLLALLAVSAAYKAAFLGVDLSYQEACSRELAYALLAGCYALDVISGLNPLWRRTATEAALGGTVILAAAGSLALLLPGAHPDYRHMIPTALVAALLLCCALFGCDDRLDRVACWGLALVFMAQAAHYVGWELGWRWARAAAWLHVIAWLWTMARITKTR